jgi:5-methylthioadenosine/S-adenosylhomocysteine deaminase
MSKTLITDALLLTMDDDLGTLPRGDVLLDGPHISAVGPDLLRPPDAEIVDGRDRIVMPGFVDTHRHMWAAMLRGCSCYGGLDVYARDVAFTYGPNFTPQDTNTSVRFGLAEAIDSGITTVHAWEHNIQTPRHADAALAALEESGMRGRFSYGPSGDPAAGSSFAQGTETIDLNDVLRIRKERFRDDDGLLHLGIASLGIEYSQPDVWQQEFSWARERGLPITTHTMMDADDLQRIRGINAYQRHNALGPDLLLVHAVHTNDAERGYLAETQTPVSVSILSEMRMGMGIPPIVEMLAAGVPLSLSIDTMAGSDNSDFFALLRAALLVPRGIHRDATVIQPDAVLRMGTIAGARALGLAAVTGSLTPGKRADVIVIRGDDLNMAPLNVADGQVVLAGQPRNVEHVWIDGVARKRDGMLVGVNQAALVSDAKAAVAGLSARLGRVCT